MFMTFLERCDVLCFFFVSFRLWNQYDIDAHVEFVECNLCFPIFSIYGTKKVNGSNVPIPMRSFELGHCRMIYRSNTVEASKLAHVEEKRPRNFINLFIFVWDDTDDKEKKGTKK